jgi:DNA processing protein
MPPNLHHWLAILHAQLDMRKVIAWLSIFSIEELFQAAETDLLEAGLDKNSIQKIKQLDHTKIAEDLAWINAEKQQSIITFADEAYPPLLKKISSPPPVLYILGKKENVLAKQMAIVGSRDASLQGLQNTHHLASGLVQAGFVITSGLALGIDAAAHKAALAAHGRTIAVAGTGLKYIYPLRHKGLAADIIKQDGSIISEFPLATRAAAFNFPRRNRIIAGLSLGVLIVEAALKSGSLITARLALEEGREVFAVPGNILGRYQGCHYLIKQGAKLVESVEDILNEFPDVKVPTSLPMSAQVPPLEPQYQQILEKIGYEMTPIDAIIIRSGLTASQVSSILLRLELYGYIQSVTGGYIKCSVYGRLR